MAYIITIMCCHSIELLKHVTKFNAIQQETNQNSTFQSPTISNEQCTCGNDTVETSLLLLLCVVTELQKPCSLVKPLLLWNAPLQASHNHLCI